MKISKIHIISLVVIALMFVGAYLTMSTLPTKIATHWNFADQADGFTENKNFVFFIPALAFIVLEIYMWIQKFDPLHKNAEEIKKYYEGVGLVITLFFAYLQCITMLWNISATFSMSKALSPAFACLFIFIGYILPKTKQNWFLGVRTPWAMTNENNWQKTHEFGGKLFIFSGFIMLLGVVLGPIGLGAGIACVLISSIIVYFYSYKLSKKK